MRGMRLNDLCYMRAVMHDRECAMALDLLLSRVLGEDCFDVQMVNEPRRWVFRFWATEEEGQTIDAMIDEVMQKSLDMEYEQLMAVSKNLDKY